NINGKYQAYLEKGELSELFSYDFLSLNHVGHEVCSDEELNGHFSTVFKQRAAQVKNGLISVGDAKRKKKIEEMYENNDHKKIDRDERIYLTNQTRILAVKSMFDRY